MNVKKNAAIDFFQIIAVSVLVVCIQQRRAQTGAMSIAFFVKRFDFERIVELFFLILGFYMYKYLSNSSRKELAYRWNERIGWLFSSLFVTVLAGFVLWKISELVNGAGTHSYGLFDLMVNILGLQQFGLFKTYIVNSHTWILSALLFSYIVLIISIKISEKKRVSMYIPFGLIIVISTVILSYGWNTVLLNSGLARSECSFFSGLILGRYLSLKNKAKWEKYVVVLPVVFVFLIWCLPGWIRDGAVLLYMIMLWIPLLIILSRWNPEWKEKSETIELMGSAALSVYLWNEPLSCLCTILKTTMGLRVDARGFLIIFVIVNWLIGVASYSYLEKPLADMLIRKAMNKTKQKNDNGVST